MDATTTDTPDTSPPPKKKSKLRLIIRIIIILAVLIGIAIGVWYYFRSATIYPSTDDAYVRAHVLNVAPQVSGQIETINTQDLRTVKKGQLLFSISSSNFTIAVNQAEAELALAKRNVESAHVAIKVAAANVKEREANLKDTQGRTRRTLEIAKKGFASQQAALNATTQLSNANATLAHAKTALIQATVTAGKQGALNAQIQKAQANVAEAKLNLSYTKIYAPTDGTIINFKLRPNSWVTQGRAVFSVIEDSKWWVDANFKETYVNYIKVGMPANIHIDMYPNTTFKGYVGHISRGSGTAFALLPAENATGNWVKVTRRFPVRVFFLHPNRKTLRVGASTVITINTTKLLKDHEQPHD